jgi:8-amino-7-oxononanoate synthase
MAVLSATWDVWLNERLDEWEAQGLRRELRAVRPVSPVEVTVAGRSLILFSSNDYLGLSGHPRVREAAVRCLRDSGGMGPRGSALVCGYTEEHEALEEDLARLKGTETSLLFPTGYAANLAVLTSLADEEVTFFSDELNHASLIDGCRLANRSGAKTVIYPHKDTARLAELLAQDTSRRKAIVTDTVFSMDGDLAPLEQLAQLKKEHQALLVVDDAHGTLVFGEHGQGVPGALGVTEDIDLQVGTLSKAFGSQGGFVATSNNWKTWLLNRGRSFVFSTALPLPIVAAARESIAVTEEEGGPREALWRNVERVRGKLEIRSESPIIPVVIGGNVETLEVSQKLWERGFHVPGIRPPTVPAGTGRLRVALSGAHTPEQVEALLEALRSAVQFG